MTDSVKFTSSKFDEYEGEKLEREARIVELESKVVSLSTEVEKLEYKLTEWSNIQDVAQH